KMQEYEEEKRKYEKEKYEEEKHTEEMRKASEEELKLIQRRLSTLTSQPGTGKKTSAEILRERQEYRQLRARRRVLELQSLIGTPLPMPTSQPGFGQTRRAEFVRRQRKPRRYEPRIGFDPVFSLPPRPPKSPWEELKQQYPEVNDPKVKEVILF